MPSKRPLDDKSILKSIRIKTNYFTQETKIEDEIGDKRVANFKTTGVLSKDSKTGNMRNNVLLKVSEPLDKAYPPYYFSSSLFSSNSSMNNNSNSGNSTTNSSSSGSRSNCDREGYWFLYVFKNDDIIDTIKLFNINNLKQSMFLFGRDDNVVDILAEHTSISKQHCVIQFRKTSLSKYVKPYIMDLNSTNKTRLNNKVIEPSRYIELREEDVIIIGESSREYVLMFKEYQKK